MEITDDRLKAALSRLAKEGELNGGDEALFALAVSIPLAGNAISSILGGVAKRRVAERATDVFQAVKERLENVEKTKIDEEYFKSDEFMTVLLLAIEQLQTTHDKQKLGMLANAIANSGRVEFSSESRKELFIRIMRDLSPQHVAMLSAMSAHRLASRTNPTGEHLTLLQSLAAHGLVEESYEKQQPPGYRHFTNERQVIAVITKAIAAPEIHRFELSDFGAQFLKFFNDLDSSS
jgi:hypothetical protein